MRVFCKLQQEGTAYFHELCTYTRETASDQTVTQEYTRFLSREGLLHMSLQAVTDPEYRVSRYRLTLINESEETVRFSRCGVALGFESNAVKLHYFSSDWGSEFSPCEKQVESRFSYGVETGRASKGFTNYAGLDTSNGYYGMALAWSGNWLFEIEPLGNGCFAASMEINPKDFFIDLAPGQTFTTPDLYVSEGTHFDDADLEMRRYFARRLSILNREGIESMPLEYNTWWPYEDKFINEDVYLANAKTAKDLGCSYAMMDAGWFGTNEDGQSWYEKRGDWDLINTRDFPSGMQSLMDKAKEIGILPGMWCEIEAVGAASKLHETHPSILAKRDGASLGYVCFGSQAGYDWAMGVVDKILGEYGARWIKFDFNLDPGSGCNRTDHGHGAGDGLYAHYRGYYRFLREVHAKYPEVVLENCSSGGLRLDIGMMAHTHWTHLSDPDSTEFHLQCYWGALSYLHQSACLHFSWSEILGDHNLGIQNPITEDMPKHTFDYIIRAVLTGVPGFSYRLVDFPEWCLTRLKELGAFYTKISGDFILRGDAYRLTPQPRAGMKGERFPVFEFVSEDKRAVVFAYRLRRAQPEQTVKLRGLDSEREYTVCYEDSALQYAATGQELMENGLRFAGMPEESSEVAVIE